MAKARVTLRETGPLSLTVNGVKYIKGESIVTTNAADIARFKIEPEFIVEMLEEESEAPPRAKAKRAVDEDVDDEGSADGEITDEELDEAEEGDGESKPKKPKKSKKVKPLTEDDMRAVNKKQIIEAAEERGIAGLDPSATKADLIATVIQAQKE